MKLPPTIEITQDIRGQAYAELIGFAFAVAEEGFFVVRDQLKRSSDLDAFLANITPWVISDHEVSAWPGTQLLDERKARLITFRTTAEVEQMILPMTDHLFGWLQPALPGDIGFRDQAGGLVIESTIHECYLAIHLDELRERVLAETYARLFQICLNAVSGKDDEPM
jgi:hypothetical protein